MSNQVQFQSFDFNSSAVRVIQDPNQEPWFCGTDVCSILGYINAPDALKKHCKETGIAKHYISYPSGRKEAIFINEPNLYRLIIKSRKPEAEKFEAWVFEEVLPQLRKTGKYQVQQQIALPVEKTFPHEFKNHEAVDMAWLWYEAHRMADFIKTITPALEAIHSGFAAEAHSMGVEYRNHIQHIGKLIYHLTADADFGYNPKPLDTLKKATPARKQYGSCDF